jgi:nitrate/TMAO reductase-like tetraheme cytochrome c subunit
MRLWLLIGLLGCADKVEPAEGVDSGTSSGLEEPVVVDTGEPPETYDDLQSAQYCGECHPQHYSDWRQSMHSYAARSPVFDEMAAKAFRDTAGGVGSFCTGCHTPLGTLDGEPGSTVASERSERSLEGVTCTVCHQAVAVTSPIGNGSLVHDFEAPMQGPFDDPVSVVGHTSVGSDVISSPELCGSCHDVFNFPGLRIEEAFTEYQGSPSRAAGVRCQDCHMGPEPGVASPRDVGPVAVVAGFDFPDRPLSSHRFVGPDYSLLDDFPYADDLDASLVAQAELNAQIQTLLGNAVHINDAVLIEGADGTELSVVIESLTPGHNVPTGFTSERQLWVSVTVTEGEETVYVSGDLDTWGDLRDPLSLDVITGAAEIDEDLVNFQSLNLLRVGDVAILAFDVYETVFPFDADYIWRRSLAPLEAREVTYPLPELGSGARIEVGLHYRNLPPYLLRGLQLDDLVERLQVFRIDTVVIGGGS